MQITLSPYEIIVKQRSVIMNHPKFVAMSGLLMTGTWTIDNSVPTAATNGLNVVYNGDFILSFYAKYDLETANAIVRFVILHEAFHILLMHLTVYSFLMKQDAKIANLAMDAVINLMLDIMAGSKTSNPFIIVWEHAVLDYKYKDMDTLTVFNLMRKEQEQAQRQGAGNGAGKGGQPQPGPTSASGGVPQPMDEHIPGAEPAPTADEGDENGTGVAPAGMEPLTPEQAATVRRTVDTALRQGAQNAGRMGGAMDRRIMDLLEPVVDWMDHVSEFLRQNTMGSTKSTWRRPSRRGMILGVPLPSRYSEGAKSFVLAIDTSGSISTASLRRALSEISALAEASHVGRVDLIFWDHRVAVHEIYEGENVRTLAESTCPKGGGGTDVRKVFEYIDKKALQPECVIVFTDGETPWMKESPMIPTLWCISNKKIKAPFGKTIHIPAT